MIPTKVLTIKKTLYEGDATSITAEGTQGQFTILPNHLPIITGLKQGTITIKQSGKEPEYIQVIEKGIFELSNGKATILLS